MIIRHGGQFMLLAWIWVKERSQKLVTTLVIHHEDSTVVITLPFQILAEHISIHEINCKIDKFVWKNRRVSKFRGEFPLPISILIIWSHTKIVDLTKVFTIYTESLKWLWNDMNDSGIKSSFTFNCICHYIMKRIISEQ